MSQRFVPRGPINNIPALVQIMAWCRPGEKPLSEPMMARIPTHICVTRPQRVNLSPPSAAYKHQWIESALVQIMACRLFCAKPLCKPVLGYCQLDPRNKLHWNFNQNTKLFIHENTSEISSVKWRPYCPGVDELTWMVMKDCSQSPFRTSDKFFITKFLKFFLLIWTCEVSTCTWLVLINAFISVIMRWWWSVTENCYVKNIVMINDHLQC